MTQNFSNFDWISFSISCNCLRTLRKLRDASSLTLLFLFSGQSTLLHLSNQEDVCYKQTTRVSGIDSYQKLCDHPTASKKIRIFDQIGWLQNQPFLTCSVSASILGNPINGTC